MAGNKLSAQIDLDLSSLEKNAAAAADIIAQLRAKMTSAFSGTTENAGAAFTASAKAAEAGFDKAEQSANEAKSAFDNAGASAKKAGDNINTAGGSTGGFNKAEAGANRFTKTLGQLQAQLKRFEAGLKTATNQASFDRINRAIDATKQKINALNTGGMDKFVRGQRQAGQAVTDFSRIVQDAPYVVLSGNISAIANNIDPFVLSLQRAKTAGGGFTGTMKAIGSSLAGGAGIGLAISLVTSGLVLFGDKLFGASAATKAANAAIKELAGTIAKDLVQLGTLVGLIENVNTSQVDRKKALEAVNQEYKTHLDNLGIEEVKLSNLRVAYDKVIESMLNQAVLKGLQAEITAEVEKTAGAIIKLRKEAAARANEAKKGATDEQKEAKAREDLTKNIQLNNQARRDGAIALQDYNKKIVDTVVIEESLVEQLKRTLGLTEGIASNFSDLGIKLDDTGKKGEKALNDIISKAKELSSFFDKKSIRQIEFEIDPRDTLQEQAKKARDFIERVSTSAGRLTFPVEIDAFFNTDINFIKKSTQEAFNKLPGEMQDLQDKLLGEADKLTGRNPILVEFNANLKKIKANNAEIEKAAAQLSADVQNAFGNAISGTAEAIGDALSGADFGSKIFQVLGDFISQIGQALIKFAIARAGLDAILKNPLISPAAAFALGFAAIALGQAVKNIRPAGARAQGGPVSPGQPIIVGEQGREVFVPSTAGRIVSNKAIDGAGAVGAGRMAVTVGGEFVLRGTNLVAAIALANKSQGRLS